MHIELLVMMDDDKRCDKTFKLLYSMKFEHQRVPTFGQVQDKARTQSSRSIQVINIKQPAHLKAKCQYQYLVESTQPTINTDLQQLEKAHFLLQLQMTTTVFNQGKDRTLDRSVGVYFLPLQFRYYNKRKWKSKRNTKCRDCPLKTQQRNLFLWRLTVKLSC